MELGGCGLSGLLRAGRAGQQRSAVAPKVASSPRAAIRRPSCGVASSIPAAGVVVWAAVILGLAGLFMHLKHNLVYF
jgi:hypothetical protein